MSLSATNNTSLTRNLTTREGGQDKSVAVLTGHVTPRKVMTLSIMINDEQLATDHQADVADALDAFIDELRTLAQENGVPI